jgi:uncharacterized protein (DUF488 family)
VHRTAFAFALMPMIERLLTIGVYGKTETEFFNALERARVTMFCDVRRRRGVRGSQYAFVNSKYLQAALAKLGIEYQYLPELAPTQEIRDLQHSADAEGGVSKRARQELSEEFKRKYAADILGSFDSRSFAHSFNSRTHRVVFFCVEGSASACHRSLVTERIWKELDVPVEHL